MATETITTSRTYVANQAGQWISLTALSGSSAVAVYSPPSGASQTFNVTPPGPVNIGSIPDGGRVVVTMIAGSVVVDTNIDDAGFADSTGQALVRPDGSISAIGLVLGAFGAAVTAPLDTSDNTLATITVPAQMMGPNSVIQVRTLWSMTSSANAKNMRVKFGGTAYMDVSLTTQATEHVMVCIRNAGSRTAQKGWIAGNVIGFGSSGSPLITSSVDTDAEVSLLITGQKASGAESLVLEAYDVVLYP